MSYAEHWFALATRIKSLQSAGELYARFQSYRTEDAFRVGRYLRDQCADAIFSLEVFRGDFANSLPPEAQGRLDHFFGMNVVKAAKDRSRDEEEAARGALVALVTVEAEVTFILSGRQEQIRARSERAFMLLQRTLAVDDEVRAKWKAALSNGEVACERLGSVHLLSQGIFAFKVGASGARTDLVFAEPPEESLLTRGVEGLVLTEWKVATAHNAASKFAEAKAQAELYKEGALAGVELTEYRYLVAVSEEAVPSVSLPSNKVTPEGIIYRHINLVVQPAVPSKAARSAIKKSTIRRPAPRATARGTRQR
jgi:hypothetical protein